MSVFRPRENEPVAQMQKNNVREADRFSLHIVWIFPASLEKRLDAATWLETTEKLRELGWRVTLIGTGQASEQHCNGVRVTHIPRPDTYLLGQMLFQANVVRYILRHWNRIDVVFFHQDSAIWLLPLRFLRLLRRQKRPQIIMDTRDLQDSKPGSLRVALRGAFERFSHWLANHFADGQTAITERFAELVAIPQHQLWGIWPSGVDPEPFAEAAVMRYWPSVDEPIALVYIGMLLEKRHPVPLCQAVKRANEQGMDFELYYYGDGPEAALVRDCAATSQGKVKVLPPIAHEDIPNLLAQMHVGVTSLPRVDDAKYAASSPIKMFEYMASGMPVLATANACHSEVVDDGAFAFWIDYPDQVGVLDALAKIWARREYLETLGDEAARKVVDWTWEAAASKLDNALKSGLEKHSIQVEQIL